MQKHLKLTFVSKKTTCHQIGNKTVVNLYSGFKFSKFDSFFEKIGFARIPPVVIAGLYNLGYKRDYKLGMWVIKTTGVSECSPTDVFDEVRGRRIATSRAKMEAYSSAQELSRYVMKGLSPIYMLFQNTNIEMNAFKREEKIAINNVIETGVSNPVK